MSKIFISYRREDSAGYTGRIYDHLIGRFNRDQIFMDIDNIPLGVSFVKAIQKQVSECDVMLAVIGKNWLSVTDKGGQRRLDNPKDYVRLEIATALKREIFVIPVLIDGATVPKENELPDDLKLLEEMNGIAINHPTFKGDVDRLMNALLKHIAPPAPVDGIRVEPPPSTNPNPIPEPPTTTRPVIPDLGTVTSPPPPAPGPRPAPAQHADFAIFRDRLKDGGEGPEMIRIPTGQFRMGDLSGKGQDWEKPVHTVRIARPFAIGRYAVTFEEYEAYTQATCCPVPDDRGWGRGRRPVIIVSWNDAQAYCQWLSEQTGKRYRLPSEAEWEYAARSGTETQYWWGDDIGTNRANCDGPGSEWSGKQTSPVGSFQPNPWGLYDTAGNVWEWVRDVWHDNYEGAPADGSAWESPSVSSSWFGLVKKTDPERRVIRGGSWVNQPDRLRSAFRGRLSPDDRNNILGFRLAQDL